LLVQALDLRVFDSQKIRPLDGEELGKSDIMAASAEDTAWGEAWELL
jgi:hypothetical protein